MNHTNHTRDPFSCYSPSVVGYRYLAVLWGCVVTVIGTVGNLMTLLAFGLDPHLRTRFNVLIVNLAVADLMYCSILQPILVDSYLHLRWRSGQLWCSVFGLLLFFFNSVSIITLCLVAVSRYLLVAKQAAFDRVFSSRGLIFLLISVWALSLASLCPLWSFFVFVPEVCTCSLHRTDGRPYTTILLYFYFLAGLGCVGTFYLLIYRRVRAASKSLLQYRLSRRSSRKKPASSAQGTNDSGVESGMANTCSFEMSMQMDIAQNEDNITSEKSSQSTNSSDTCSNSSVVNMPPADIIPATPSSPPALTTVSASSDSATSGDDEFKRVTRMCLTVFLCFTVCYVPFLLLNIVDRQNSAPQILHMVCGNITWLNSCINPVLYAVMNRQFRQVYHALLTRAAAPFTCLWTWWQALRS